MRQIYLLTFFAFLSYVSYAQISYQGVPYSVSDQKKSARIIYDIGIVVNRDSLLNKSRDYKNNNLKVSIFGKAIPFKNNVIAKATVSEVSGGKLYQLSISCPNASSLGLSFSKWKLPPGGKLFVWNADKSSYIGAFTEENNMPWNGMMIRPVKGEKISIEYFEPVGQKTELEIENVIYSLEGDIFGQNDNSFGSSGSCQVNINSPEGQGWQQEKRSVVKVISEQQRFELGGGWYTKYSAALINTTANDGTPYLLTAEHCVSEDEFAQKSIFFFNYESLTPGQDGTKEQTIVGAQVMATKPDLDFSLIKLSSPVPAAYKPYFSGWERSTENFEYAVSIHHPRGDVKKISKSYKQVSAYYSYGDLLGYKGNAHWNVKEWYNGVNEGGSSGSPLFNQNHRIVGDLTGGISECGNPVSDDYQMLSVSWTDSEAFGQQLAHWLDPKKSNVMYVDGYDPFPENKVYMYPDRELCYLNEPVTFTNHSVGNYLNYRWNFGTAAIPQTATGKGPHNVYYSQLGTYTATLTVTNQVTGLDEIFTLSDYIHVFNRIATPDFKAEVAGVYINDAVVFQNNSTGSNTNYHWNFGEGATPNTLETENENPVSVVYSSSGKKTVTLTVSNPEGNKSLTRPMYVSVWDKVKADFSFTDIVYYVGDIVKITGNNYTQEGNSLGGWYINDISRINDNCPGTFIQYQVEGKPWTYALDNPWFTFAKAGTYKIKFLFTAGNLNPDDPNKVCEKTVTIYDKPVTGINDLTDQNSVRVYPNPFNNVLNVDLPEKYQNSIIQINDITGKTVYKGVAGRPISTPDLRTGIYFLKIENNGQSIVKKIIKTN